MQLKNAILLEIKRLVVESAITPQRGVAIAHRVDESLSSETTNSRVQEVLLSFYNEVPEIAEFCLQLSKQLLLEDFRAK